ncbi:MAG: hypothetical protein ACRD1R_09680 [Acidobacteriota bacterium]
MSPPDRRFLVAESTLTEMMDRARWGEDNDSLVDAFLRAKELEEVDEDEEYAGV